MSQTTRRQFLEVAGAAAAASVLAPAALATRTAHAQAPVRSPLPAGPGTPPATYQSEIYISGMGAGSRPPFTTNLLDLEEVASGVLDAAAERHLLEEAGGAAAVRVNARALDGWRILPRMLIDRAQRDLGVTVLGVAMPAPVILGPVGRQALAHPDAEPASARAAAGLGLTYVHALRASTPPEALAAASPTGSRWFGLDWPGRQGPDAALLQRVRLAGFTHLVLGPPQPGEDWAPFDAVRRAWDGPVVLGGLQTVRDAQEAVRRGADGVVVSNERGRRGGPPLGTIDMLPRVADAVGRKVPVLLGAGVRSGTDVFRALALGADAVLLGRPYVHGLALGGEAGVRHVLRSLLAELDITLAIAGVADSRRLGPDALLRA